MASTLAEPKLALGLESAGLLLTPEQFDAVKEYDENYHYELIHGVLVVTSLPLPLETGPNEMLGYLLLAHKHTHAKGYILDATLPQQYVRTRTSRRIADRLIWTGLGRAPQVRRDTPTIAVEFVSAGRRNRQRDYQDKRREYMEAGIKEYWIIDRFERMMTVVHNEPGGPREQIISSRQTYRPPSLPGFRLPLARLLATADYFAQQDD